MSNDGRKGGSIYLADGTLHGGTPPGRELGKGEVASLSSHVAQLAQVDKRNKLLQAHSQKCETAAKHFAEKLDQIAKARQVLANADVGLAEVTDASNPLAVAEAFMKFRSCFENFIDAIDVALEKKFIPEPPANDAN